MTLANNCTGQSYHDPAQAQGIALAEGTHMLAWQALPAHVLALMLQFTALTDWIGAEADAFTLSTDYLQLVQCSNPVDNHSRLAASIRAHL